MEGMKKRVFISPKVQFFNLLHAVADWNSSSPERAREYLIQEGLDPDAIVAEGLARIKALQERIAKQKDDIKPMESNFAVVHTLTVNQIVEADIQEVPVYLEQQYPSYYVYRLGPDELNKPNYETPELAYNAWLELIKQYPPKPPPLEK